MGILGSIKNILGGARNTNPEFDKIIQDSIIENNAEGFETYYEPKINLLPSYTNTVKEWTDAKKIEFVLYCLKECRYYSTKDFSWNSPIYLINQMLGSYVKHLLRTKISINENDVINVLNAFKLSEVNYSSYDVLMPTAPFLNLVKKQYSNQSLPEKLHEYLIEFKNSINEIEEGFPGKEKAKILTKINEVLQSNEAENVVLKTNFIGKDRFSSYANAAIEGLKDKKSWYRVIALSQKANGSKPTNKFLDSSKLLIDEIRSPKFKEVINNWFEFLIELKILSSSKDTTYGDVSYTENYYDFITPVNIDSVKGLIWMCAHFHDGRTLSNLTNLALKSYKKLAGFGPAAAALGNACFYTLYKSRGLDGIGKLSRLKVKIKHSMAAKTIDKYLYASAKEKGISIHEIEDLAIDDFGLDNEVCKISIGEYQAEVTLIKPGKTTLLWRMQDGKVQKSIPSVVKDKFASKLSSLKKKKKSIEQLSSAQRDRLDNMLKLERTWNQHDFSKLYLNHGLMSFFANRLIWQLEEGDTILSAMNINNQWEDSKGKKIQVTEKTQFKMWHPSVHSTAEVLEWRNFMIAKEIQQPIKQAFREVYILTEAEINTRTYSNRMAAHILKQHQYVNLAKVRNWKANLIGGWDYGGSQVASLDIPSHNIQAQFWIQDIHDDSAINESGVYIYISTDQIRFTKLESGELLELVDVPAILFSEVFRDVDLFVGVASVGNDPTWQDNGELPQFRDYWNAFSFGDLSEIAKSRKEILESLLPRLKIRNIAKIEGKFLKVQGKLRTYKIHIGSTNILMEPNDQYLCIVADRSQKSHTDKLFIPFDGDSGLSLILSKAFLLADDDKITDSTIVSQISR